MFCYPTPKIESVRSVKLSPGSMKRRPGDTLVKSYDTLTFLALYPFSPYFFLLSSMLESYESFLLSYSLMVFRYVVRQK